MIPVYFQWRTLEVVAAGGVITDLSVMVPLDRFANVCASQFNTDEQYKMEVVAVADDERTDKEHKSYMAQVSEAWKNLPEDKAKEYPTPDHLRKRALIKTGHYVLESKVFDTEKDAQRCAAYIKPLDEFAVVAVSGCVVNHYRPKSQSYARVGGMNKEEFRQSRDDVLALLAETIGVKKSELKDNAGKSA